LAIQKADAGNDIKQSAKIFGDEILRVSRITGDKLETSKAKWTGKVGTFITKLYPVAKLSLKLTSAIAKVFSMCSCST